MVSSLNHSLAYRVLGTALLAASLSGTGLAYAGDLGQQHPAVLLQSDVTALKQVVNPNTFMPAHPARLALVGGHSNKAHPAVLMAQQAAHLDTNAYRVQPPAATQWLLVSAPDVAPVVVAAAPAETAAR